MTESEMVEGLLRKDPAAIREMISANGDRLLRSAFLLCENESDAQDLVQETLVESVRSIHRFRRESALYTWLHGILVNMNRGLYRKQKKMKFTYRFPTKDITIDSKEEFLNLGQDSSVLAQLVQHLSPFYREVVILRFYEGMKVEEIARHLGLPVNTVKTRLRRAVEWLKDFLKKTETF